MIAEKSHTAQTVMEKISGGSKVNFISNDKLSRALLFLEENGFPTNKHEDYKYCNLDAIIKKEFRNVTQSFKEVSDISAYRLPDTITLVVLNGHFSTSLSDKIVIRGLHISDFGSLDLKSHAVPGSIADAESDAFIALNTVFSGNGFHLKVAKNVDIPMPIHVIYISSSASEAMVNSRNFIELEENSSLTIIEEQLLAGEGKIFTNFLSEKLLHQGAKLDSYLLQNEGKNGYSVNTSQVNLEKQCNYSNTTVTISGEVVRNNHNVILSGQRSEAHLNGLFSAREHRLVDNHTLMDHRVPHCESNELYKGIINDRSTGVFNGKIFVRKDAQKTNAYQSSKNILLSDDATINTKPQLEIYADDVKCSHGTSTGKIDENAMFYLNARGIGKENARKMLLNSFAGEVISRIGVESLRDKVYTLFENEI